MLWKGFLFYIMFDQILTKKIKHTNFHFCKSSFKEDIYSKFIFNVNYQTSNILPNINSSPRLLGSFLL